MRRKQKTDKDYCPEVRLEAGDRDRERSITFASSEEKDDEHLLEKILSRENMVKAFKRVKSNKGSSGIDGMSVYELKPYLDDHWPFIKAEILEGRYKPTAVRRVEIPKPNGGIRLLGIPTVLDRLIQQAIAQVLNEIYDNGFSDTSYGFRPGRSTHQAVRQAKDYLNAGYSSVVDIDLEKFFDKVNHDYLMSVLSEKIKDKRVLKLIRLYLKSGIMIEGVVQINEHGTPQGGPLSPLLSNILLDKLDKELESRGHKFCRYADDCSIYVRSPRAAERVLKSVSQFLEKKLKLKVNHLKSGVRTPNQMKILGFSFYRRAGEYRIRIVDGAVDKLKQKLKPIVRRSQPISIEERVKKLKAITAGWANYFKVADAKSIFLSIDEWLRFRLRMCIWKAWKKPKTKVKNLRKLGLNEQKAYEYGNSRKGYCRVAQSPILKRTLTNNFFKQLGYTELLSVYSH